MYASLFAENTDRMVLEGNVDPTSVWYGFARYWGVGMASRFPDAARLAAANNDTVHFGTSIEEVTATYLELANRLDATPASVPGTSARITGGLFRSVTYVLLQGMSSFRSSSSPGEPLPTSPPELPPPRMPRCSSRSSPRARPGRTSPPTIRRLSSWRSPVATRAGPRTSRSTGKTPPRTGPPIRSPPACRSISGRAPSGRPLRARPRSR
ncbi:hypothetical protein ACN28S_01570 [Cystobacter fuscus]